VTGWQRRFGRRAVRAANASKALASRVGTSTWFRIRATAARRRSGREWDHLLQQVSDLPAVPSARQTIAMLDLSRAPGPEHARADLLCLVLPTTAPLEPQWIERLASSLGDDVVAAAPQVVHPRRPLARGTPVDARVRSCGIDVGVVHDAPVVVALDAGRVPSLRGGVARVAAASAAALLVDRRFVEAAGGLPPPGRQPEAAVLDLCRRLRARRGAIVAVPAAVVVDQRTSAEDTRQWGAYADLHAPAMMREAAPLAAGRLRIAITTAVPSKKVAARWGDWHLAQAFARALERLGHVVHVQTFDARDAPAARACDVRVVVRGLRPVTRSAGQAHIEWIISHPDDVGVSECDAADLVLVASDRFAAALRPRTRTPVEVLLQATDSTRFRPVPAARTHVHDIAVVAKSRDVYRGAVRDAIAAGLEPAIYGSGWEAFVDLKLIRSSYVPNEDLAIVYSSIGVLLNDHWDDMRKNGFVSNRLFDALACETPVISDDMPEIATLFDGAVLTYEGGELGALVASVLADPAGARDRAARGRDVVLEHHTFDHRAREFIELLLRHGLHPNPP